MASPAVSICIPAFARPGCRLERALASALTQGAVDVEVVVGDRSGRLRAVADAFEDERVRYLDTSGLTFPQNVAAILHAARGRYLLTLMDDDEMMPGNLHALIPGLESDPRIGLSSGTCWIEDGERRYLRPCPLPPGTYPDAADAVFRRSAAQMAGGTLFRREVWDSVQPFPLTRAWDLLFAVRAALAGWGLSYVTVPVTVFQLHGRHSMSGSGDFQRDMVEVYQMFTFEDPRLERIRRERLAWSYLALATFHLRAGRYREARDAAKRADALMTIRVGAACTDMWGEDDHIRIRQGLAYAAATTPLLGPCARVGLRMLDRLALGA